MRFFRTPLTLVVLTLAACGGNGGQEQTSVDADASGSESHTIRWADDVTYAKYKFGALGFAPEELGEVCDTPLFGNYFFTVYDESGTAVASEVEAVALPKPTENSTDTFTCRYTAQFRVDDAERYRAERSAGSFEARAESDDVLQYGLIEKEDLQSQAWAWNSQGGVKKRA